MFEVVSRATPYYVRLLRSDDTAARGSIMAKRLGVVQQPAASVTYASAARIP